MKPNSSFLDRLEIWTIVVDSAGYGTSLAAQHGVSFLLKAHSGQQSKLILVDLGQNHEVLLKNLELLGISPRCIEMVVLSHCHRDHTRGLAEVIKQIQSESEGSSGPRVRDEVARKNLPIIAHRDLFKLTFVSDPYLRHFGMINEDSRKKVEDAGGTLFLSTDAIQLMPGLFTTGEIRRNREFEKDSLLNLYTIQQGRIQEDWVSDEIAVVAKVRNRGLVIITGCGHPGIINIAEQAIELAGKKKIEAILGGFHLIDAKDDRIQETARLLKQFDPRWIAAGHCTGFRAEVELFRVFGRRFAPLRAGMYFSIPTEDEGVSSPSLFFMGGIKL
jgi:7,8-dihydropterin-6-yl-methyl-4-(beta-D-ribofuranosyl)aminobenzene 5'-phosphate synthase